MISLTTAISIATATASLGAADSPTLPKIPQPDLSTGRDHLPSGSPPSQNTLAMDACGEAHFNTRDTAIASDKDQSSDILIPGEVS